MSCKGFPVFLMIFVVVGLMVSFNACASIDTQEQIITKDLYSNQLEVCGKEHGAGRGNGSAISACVRTFLYNRTQEYCNGKGLTKDQCKVVLKDVHRKESNYIDEIVGEGVEKGIIEP
jgi:hypothetical protein